MRTSGMIPYITPRQIATESSTTPKSVMKTMVGGYFCVPSLPAHRRDGTATARVSARTKRMAARNSIVFRKDKQNIIRPVPILNRCLLELVELTYLFTRADAIGASDAPLVL